METNESCGREDQWEAVTMTDLEIMSYIGVVLLEMEKRPVGSVDR